MENKSALQTRVTGLKFEHSKKPKENVINDNSVYFLGMFMEKKSALQTRVTGGQRNFGGQK